MKVVTGKIKSTVIPDLRGPGPSDVASAALEKAQLLNSFFAALTLLPGAEKEVTDLSQVPANDNEFSSMSCTPSQVFEILSALDHRKAPGLDGITPTLRRECAPGIAASLALLFNRSFHDCHVPAAGRMLWLYPFQER